MDAFAETNRNLPILPDEAFDRSHYEENAPRERDPELVARVNAIRGKYAHVGVTVEGLHRERQLDKEKEEALIRGYQP